MIAIFGNHQDPHVQEIHKRITALGHDCTKISTSRESLQNTSFVFSHTHGQSAIQIIQNRNALCINDVKAAWALQPIFPLFSTAEQSFSQELKFWFFTWRESIEAVYALLERRNALLNHSIPSAIANQNKMRYISAPLARVLKQPRTIVSNHRESLLDFFGDGHKPVILKTLHQMQLSLAGEPTMLLASIVRRADFLDFQQTNEWVPRRFVWNLTARIHRSGARWGLWATRQSELSTNPRGGVLCQGGLQDGCGH